MINDYTSFLRLTTNHAMDQLRDSIVRYMDKNADPKLHEFLLGNNAALNKLGEYKTAPLNRRVAVLGKVRGGRTYITWIKLFLESALGTLGEDLNYYTYNEPLPEKELYLMDDFNVDFYDVLSVLYAIKDSSSIGDGYITEYDYSNAILMIDEMLTMKFFFDPETAITPGSSDVKEFDPKLHWNKSTAAVGVLSSIYFSLLKMLNEEAYVPSYVVRKKMVESGKKDGNAPMMYQTITEFVSIVCMTLGMILYMCLENVCIITKSDSYKNDSLLVKFVPSIIERMYVKYFCNKPFEADTKAWSPQQACYAILKTFNQAVAGCDERMPRLDWLLTCDPLDRELEYFDMKKAEEYDNSSDTFILPTCNTHGIEHGVTNTVV